MTVKDHHVNQGEGNAIFCEAVDKQPLQRRPFKHCETLMTSMFDTDICVQQQAALIHTGHDAAAWVANGYPFILKS